MNANRPARYCRCGARLARDNQTKHCASCQAKIRDLAGRPPSVDEDFWQTPQMLDALAAHHIGHVSRAYRKHPQHIAAYGKDGISQEIVGGWLGLTQAQVSRIESGAPVKHLDSLAHWARSLRIPEHLLWFKLPSRSVTEGEFSPSSVNAIPSQYEPTRSGMTVPLVRTHTMNEGETFTTAMQSFRVADRQIGGGHLYATVVKYLQTVVAPKLFGVDQGGGDSRHAFTAAAALTEMAGWMAHDAGRDQAAEHHFERSLDLVRIGGDTQLCVHVLASMSHLVHHQRKPHDAIRLAQRGRQLLAHGPRQPELEARVLAMEARGFAALGQGDECARRLIEAEQALTVAADEERSHWTSHFDEGSLASEAARCLRQLGDLAEAQRQARRVIALRPGDRTRSRAFGQLLLVTILIRQGKPDEACAVAHEVLGATRQLGSYVVMQQLLELRHLLEGHKANPTVAEFLECLDEALRERLWLYQWLFADQSQRATAEMEKW